MRTIHMYIHVYVFVYVDEPTKLKVLLHKILCSVANQLYSNPHLQYITVFFLILRN